MSKSEKIKKRKNAKKNTIALYKTKKKNLLFIFKL